jgi:hypothetical protein
MLLLCGEAGIGKSTLARWAAEQSAGEGIAVHWGVCWEAGGAPAYWPWTQLLRSLLTIDPDGEIERLLATSPALLQLLPELADSGTPVAHIQADQARFQLLESVRTLLHRAGETRPRLLLLEDLHTADSDSLILLQYLAPHLSALPICVIGTFRDADARLSGRAEPLWHAARGADVLHLRGLGERDVDALLQQLAGASGSPEQVHALWQRTDGNPFFLTELIQLGAGDGRAVVPDSINQVIRQQCQYLPDATRRCLEAAAVIGRAFSLQELGALLRAADQDPEDELEPALQLAIIERETDDRYRFAHILYRDVVYADQEPRRQRELHRGYARCLRQAADEGQRYRWQELALHLESAGSRERAACVEAWCGAGTYARGLSAFEDAVSCHRRALELFVEGPEAEPRRRCELLLQLAEVEMARGGVEAAFAYCREAFRIARTLNSAGLMARAALIFGGAFVATHIDDELVSMLEETLPLLPATAVAERAQVSARLAAALQPAEDPRVPMHTAREAIALARQCEDQRVLLPTLRSAISALMDFAPASERYELNREYIALALRADDLAEQFRGQMRLMIDCVELGYGDGFAGAVHACDHIARSLGLPHYQWRAASAQAFRAIVQGDFDAAGQQLQVAQDFAACCEDRGADLALALQRLDLLEATAAGDTQRIEAGVQAVEDLLPELSWAEVFVRTYLLNLRRRHGLAITAAQEADDALVERVLSWGDRMSIGDLVELAVHRGDRELCERVYAALSPYADQCAHWGLMGMGWCGPIAYLLATCDQFLGRKTQALAHLQTARALAGQMRSGPALRKIDALQKALENGREPLAAVVPCYERLALQADGEMWRVTFGGDSALLKDSRGLQLLARLLDNPDREIHVLDLVGAATAAGADSAAGQAGLDEQARQAYQRRLEQLQEALQEAVEFGDIGRAEQAREEIEFIGQELSRAFGLGGRERKTGSDAERARVNVQRRLKDAVRRIGEQIPDAGRYLQGTLDTGTYCRYRPL